MTFDTPMFGLPIMLGTINAAAEQNLLIYTLTAGAQVEVANYPTVRLDLSAEYHPADWGSFNEFVDAQFEATRQAVGETAAIIEYVGPTDKGDPPTTDPSCTLGGCHGAPQTLPVLRLATHFVRRDATRTAP